jgi:DNA-directed RNA polymerase specialized sigma24 family protein
VQLRCLGFSLEKIAAVEGVSYKAVWKRFDQVKAKVRIVLQEEHPGVDRVGRI